MNFQKLQIPRILTFVFTFYFCFFTYGQQAQENQFRSGISFAVETVKATMPNNLLIQTQSISPSLGYNLEFFIKNRFAIFTGLDLEMSNTKFVDNIYDSNYVVYFSNVKFNEYYEGKNIVITQGEINNNNQSNNSFNTLKRRQQIGLDLSLPIFAEFFSKFHNYSRFFIKAGPTANFKVYNKSKDEAFVQENTPYGDTKLLQYKINTKDMNFFYVNMAIGTGFEWNFSGSQGLRLEFGYTVNLSPIYKNENSERHLYSFSNKYSTYYYAILHNGSFKGLYDNQLHFHQVKMRITYTF